MDARTIQFYESDADRLGDLYRSAGATLQPLLDNTFRRSATILDVGCGSGRDLLYLLKQGKDAIGVDPSANMRQVAERELQSAGIDPARRIVAGALPDLKELPDKSFDGILCTAVLMHLPEEEVFDAVFTLRRLLKPGCPLLVSIPEERNDVDSATQRDGNGRLYTSLPHAKISLLFERVGFTVRSSEVVPDSLGRQGVSWRVIAFRLDDTAEKPLHLVESILNRDKKDATYKLALFRALAEIAQTQHHLAVYLAGSKVGVPIAAIAEKWLLYYWPIFAHGTFIPQRTREKRGGRAAVRIRKPLDALIEHYRPTAGLPGFHADLQADRLPDAVQTLYTQALSSLKHTIWDMPVRHAGGRQFDVLGYDRQAKLVLMSDSLWRELCLTGSWIQDATILRWAELTERLSGDTIKASVVIDCLLKIPDPRRRSVNEAKGYYLGLRSPVCVWSDRALTASRLAIDHAMPFSLWRNDDLWNLFPADERINNEKRDRLPTYGLLQRRRDTIIGYWEGVADALRPRFEREAQTLLGRAPFEPRNWQSKLFARFVEAFEVTASQRGAARWEPSSNALGAWNQSNLASANTPTDVGCLDGEREGASKGPPTPEMVPFHQVGPDAFIRFLPVLGTLAAGDRFHGFETASINDLADVAWVAVPERVAGRNRFVVRVAGDSMEPTLTKGDLAVFEYHRTPRQDGRIVVANVPDFGMTEIGAETIKRLRQDANYWIFESDNPDHPSFRVSKYDTAYPILGIFVSVLGR